MTTIRQRDTAGTGGRLRNFVLLVFVAGTLGTSTELVLLGHVEDVWQWVPVALLPFSLLVVAWHRLDRAPRSTRVLQGVLGLCVAGGAAGLWFHYAGNAAFELEMYPSMAGWELVRETLTGATPVLAPAAMIQLGLLGLTYTYRHPFLERGTAPADSPPGDSPAASGRAAEEM